MKTETVIRLVRPLAELLIGAVLGMAAGLLIGKHAHREAEGDDVRLFKPGIYTQAGNPVTPLYLPGEIVFIGTARGSGPDGKLVGPFIMPIAFGKTYSIDRETNAPKPKPIQELAPGFHYLPDVTSRGGEQ